MDQTPDFAVLLPSPRARSGGTALPLTIKRGVLTANLADNRNFAEVLGMNLEKNEE
jgi:hypothetical protein